MISNMRHKSPRWGVRLIWLMVLLAGIVSIFSLLHQFLLHGRVLFRGGATGPGTGDGPNHHFALLQSHQHLG